MSNLLEITSKPPTIKTTENFYIKEMSSGSVIQNIYDKVTRVSHDNSIFFKVGDVKLKKSKFSTPLLMCHFVIFYMEHSLPLSHSQK